MRAAWAGLIVLLAVGAARPIDPDDDAENFRLSNEELEEKYAPRWDCHDGQRPTEEVPCDFDGRADGSCTFFGPSTERHVAVPVGVTRTVQRHVRAYLRCRAPCR